MSLSSWEEIKGKERRQPARPLARAPALALDDVQVCSLLLFSGSHSTWKSKKAQAFPEKPRQMLQTHCAALRGAWAGLGIFPWPLLALGRIPAFPWRKDTNSGGEGEQAVEERMSWAFFLVFKGWALRIGCHFPSLGVGFTGENGNVPGFDFFQTTSCKVYLTILPHRLKYKQLRPGQK